MRKPNRHEALALTSVWLMWPALAVTGAITFPLIAELGASLPLHAKLAFNLIYWNRFAIPSVVGTILLILIARYGGTQELKSFLWHLLTLIAFCFTIAVNLSLLTMLIHIG